MQVRYLFVCFCFCVYVHMHVLMEVIFIGLLWVLKHGWGGMWHFLLVSPFFVFSLGIVNKKGGISFDRVNRDSLFKEKIRSILLMK